MVENNSKSSDDEDDSDLTAQELSIEKACEEYSNSVKLTLTLINHQIDDSLLKHYEGLEELGLKIAARTNFLEKNPTFLSCLSYFSSTVKTESLREFDELLITVEEHQKRITDKVKEIEGYHKKLLDLVLKNSRDQRIKDEIQKIKDVEKTLEQNATDEEKMKESFDTVMIQKNAFSEISLQSITSRFSGNKSSLFPDVPAEVERRKPFEDIHSKLLKQLEAADSLEGFIRLMNRKPNKKKTKSQTNHLEQKYTGSLWFFPPKKTKKQVKNNKNEDKQKNDKRAKSESAGCNLLVTSRTSSLSSEKKLRKKNLKCYDLLDDIEGKDLKPIKSEYPRRDNLPETPTEGSKSYLHRIMGENDNVWKKLFQPVSLKPEAKRVKTRNVNNLMAYLTAPEQKFLTHVPQSLIVMPVKIVYDNFPTKDVDNKDKLKDVVFMNTLISPLERVEVMSPRTRALPSATKTTDKISPIPLERKKEMLNQLRGLKMKNDSLQKNIQNAIGVIETKMVDLLSSPTESGEDAFNAMEEEITKVLKLMKETEDKEEAERDDSCKVKSKPRRVPKKSGTPEPEKKEGSKAEDSVKTKPKQELKKAADIEEGERLLGQVDNVIKKIDTIYTKLYDETRLKGNFNTVSNVVKNAYSLEWCYQEIYPNFQEAICYYQPQIYYEVRIQPPVFVDEKGDFIQPDIEEEQHEDCPQMTGNEETAEDGEVQAIEEQQETKPADNNQHDFLLKTFYAIFFLFVFIGLNLDYVS